MSNFLPNYSGYKFFFVETTAKCNLKCKYCYFKKSERNAEFSADELVEKLLKYEKIIICFLGGEPFLNVDLIKQIMEHNRLSGNKVVFASNTNGTLMNTIETRLLSRFAFHHISIDGYGEHHDAFRGKGVFERIVQNINYLKKISDAGIIARMTISSPNQILDIPKLEGISDAVYWQLNNTRSELADDFNKHYLPNLKVIYEFWKSIIFKNSSFTIIPFSGICYLIMTGGMKKPDLICGAGTDHFNICIDGNIYPCPESANRLSSKERLGNIKQFVARTYRTKKRCVDCAILRFCGGRCAMTDDSLYCEGILEIYSLLTGFLSEINLQQKEHLKKVLEYQMGLAFTTEITP